MAQVTCIGRLNVYLFALMRCLAVPVTVVTEVLGAPGAQSAIPFFFWNWRLTLMAGQLRKPIQNFESLLTHVFCDILLPNPSRFQEGVPPKVVGDPQMTNLTVRY